MQINQAQTKKIETPNSFKLLVAWHLIATNVNQV